MIKDENEEKIPLLEMLEDSVRKAIKNARMEDRATNQEQYAVMQNVCEVLSRLIGGEAKVYTYPEFSAGYVTIVVSDINLTADEMETLKSALDDCTVLSVEPLLNGNIELGVTIPNVFYPLNHKPT